MSLLLRLDAGKGKPGGKGCCALILSLSALPPQPAQSMFIKHRSWARHHAEILICPQLTATLFKSGSGV